MWQKHSCMFIGHVNKSAKIVKMLNIMYVLMVTDVLYHTEEETESDQPGSSVPDTMAMLYKDFLKEAGKEEPAKPTSHKSTTEDHCPVSNSSHSQSSHNILSHGSVDKRDQPPPHSSQESCSVWVGVTDRCADQSSYIQNSSASQPQNQDNQKTNQVSALNRRMDVSQSIGALLSPTNTGSQLNGPMTVTGQVELIPEEEILKNKETEEGIRSIPRFQNYQQGEPSNVSVNNSRNVHLVNE